MEEFAVRENAPGAAREMLLRRLVAVRRRTWVIGGIFAAAIVVVAALFAAAHVPFSSETLRQRVETALGERLESDVELDGLVLRFAPELRIVGTGLLVRHKGRKDLAPLIHIRKFTVRTGLLALVHKHITSVVVDGLDIEIPPGPEKTSAQELAQMHQREAHALDRAKRAASERSASSSGTNLSQEVTIDTLVANEAKLVVLPRDPSHYPKVWAMRELRLHDVRTGQSMRFHSVLSNGVPPGDVDTTGNFGPWDADEPGDTPIDGTFTLTHADLSVFKGIGGVLSARGSYAGTLGTMRVVGDTNTPEFTVALGNQPVPLKAKYAAVVDAMNGDTLLEEVDASFLDTSLTAKGGVYDVQGAKGRLVRLDVVMNKGRMEDVLRFAVNASSAPMAGALTLHTKFEIPPGDEDIVQKLKLNGSFEIRGGRFTDAGVQQKIAELSRRASGKVKEAPPDAKKVTSTFAGTFALGNGTLRLPRVTFDVPGAVVDVSGRYGLRPPQPLAFTGNLVMDAKISETTTGIKSLLLKAVDPLFRRNGRTVVPLKITGTRGDPSFGLDVKRVFSKGDD